MAGSNANPHITEIQAAISEIVHTIPVGLVFDSHFVITELMARQDNIYAKFSAAYAILPKAHSEISKMIDGCACERLLHGTAKLNSFSKNVRDNASLNAAWIRLKCKNKTCPICKPTRVTG